MAWLSADASFDPDTLNTPLIGVQSTLNGDHDDGLHRHQMGQMLFTRQGCIRLTLNDGALLCYVTADPRGVDPRRRDAPRPNAAHR